MSNVIESTSHYGNEADATNVVLTLKAHGFIARFVGGVVRDKILGLHCKDIDIVTSATPEEVLSVFGTQNASLVGASFGVVIVKTPSGPIDVASMRVDGSSADARHPGQVSFTRDPFLDSKRRDFTCNALGYDPTTGEYFDYHNGIEHLRQRKLITVGNAEDRFLEDLLRVVRLVRFSVIKNLIPDSEAMEAARKLASQVPLKISAERIVQELDKSFSANPARTFELLEQTNLLQYLFPELLPYKHAISNILQKISCSANFVYAAMFSQISCFLTISNILKRLKFSNENQFYIMSLIKLQVEIHDENNAEYSLDVIKKLVRRDFFKDAIKLYEIRANSFDENVSFESLWFFQESVPQFTYAELFPEKLITGDDLIGLGYASGKIFKTILETVENLQLQNILETRQDALNYIADNFPIR